MIEILKFSRKGCGPCRVLTTFFRDIDLEAHGATLREIDTDEEEDAVKKYKIGSVPTVKFFRNGVEITEFVGLRGTDEIIDAINVAKEAR